MPLSTQILEDWDRVRALAPEWNGLLERSRADCIFLRWEWIDAWRRVIGESVKPLVVAVRDEEGALVGVGPFYVTRMHLGGIVPYRALQTLGDFRTAAEYPDWIAREDRERETVREIARALADARERWACMWMPVVAGWTGARERISWAAGEAGMLVRERPTEFSSIALPDDFELYLKALSQNARSVLRRRRKQILGGGDVKFVRCEREEERPEFLEALFDLNHKRWAAEGLTGTFRRKPLEAAFYREFTRVALENGWLRIYALRNGRDIGAVQFGYAYKGTFLQLQEGFDPGAPDGMGNALRGLVIERCIQEGVRTYDFLGEHGDHKRRWLAEPRTGYDILVGRPCWRTSLLFSAKVWPTGRYFKPVKPVEEVPVAASALETTRTGAPAGAA